MLEHVIQKKLPFKKFDDPFCMKDLVLKLCSNFELCICNITHDLVCLHVIIDFICEKQGDISIMNVNRGLLQ